MNTSRVTPWQDEEPVDADLLNAIKARRPGEELTGIGLISPEKSLSGEKETVEAVVAVATCNRGSRSLVAPAI